MNSVVSYYKYVLIALLFILQTTNVMGAQKADAVLVIKSEKRLYLMREGEPFASFRVSFGSNPRGHKQEQYKSIHISYPNAKDRKEARKRGADPGGDIMIHGQKNGYGRLSFLVQRFNWTNGCIALSDRDIDTVWNAVKPGTPIEIKP
jgi:murein L,D-transpeptidase YafK